MELPFDLLPPAVGAGVGFVEGYVSRKWFPQHVYLVRGSILAAGAGAAYLGADPDISASLMVTGAALLGGTLGARLADPKVWPTAANTVPREAKGRPCATCAQRQERELPPPPPPPPPVRLVRDEPISAFG